MEAVDAYFKLKIIEEIIGGLILVAFGIYALIVIAKEWWGRHRRKK